MSLPFPDLSHLRDQELAPGFHSFARARGHFEDGGMMANPMEIGEGLLTLKPSGPRQIHFGQDRHVSGVEHGRVLERFIFSLGRREQDYPEVLSQVVNRGADQVADVLDDQDIQGIQVQLLDRPSHHLRLQMANRSRRDLNHGHSGGPKPFGIVVRGQVPDHHSHAQSRLQRQRRHLDEGGLSRAGGGDHIQDEKPFGSKAAPISFRQAIILSQNRLMHFNLLRSVALHPAWTVRVGVVVFVMTFSGLVMVIVAMHWVILVRRVQQW